MQNNKVFYQQIFCISKQWLPLMVFLTILSKTGGSALRSCLQGSVIDVKYLLSLPTCPESLFFCETFLFASLKQKAQSHRLTRNPLICSWTFPKLPYIHLKLKVLGVFGHNVTENHGKEVYQRHFQMSFRLPAV